MTETYGIWCDLCQLRYRRSVCRKEKVTHWAELNSTIDWKYRLYCPSGHDVTEAPRVYRRTSKHFFYCAISKNGQRYFDEAIRRGLLNAFIELWKIEVREKQLPVELIGAIDSLAWSASISDRDWHWKCMQCKHMIPRTDGPPPPGNCAAFSRWFGCARGYEWHSIYCPDYEYKLPKEEVA